jgi:hypothetical protein
MTHSSEKEEETDGFRTKTKKIEASSLRTALYICGRDRREPLERPAAAAWHPEITPPAPTRRTTHPLWFRNEMADSPVTSCGNTA